MIFPASFEQKLGFDSIRKLLLGYCLGPLGRENVNLLASSTSFEEIGKNLSETAEMRHILEFEEHFPAQDYYDMVPALLSVSIPGTYLETDQLAELRLSLTTIVNLYEFLSGREEKYPCLRQLARTWTTSPMPDSDFSNLPIFLSSGHLISAIGRIMDDKSDIRDSASPDLQRIRKEKIAKQASVERKVIQSFKMARQSGWVPEDAEITLRNGRLVIPMISTHKRKVQGFVHDESATGHTVYVEPVEIFETNNEIRELEYDERREIVKILVEFATLVRPDIDLLVHAYRFLGKIDFIRAKARLAVDTHGRRPMGVDVEHSATASGKPGGSPVRHLLWRSALHPLLYLSHTRQNKPVVPLDITLNDEQRILIISGPNAGGKSVCLKTVGLLQYMYQCGLLPPVKEDSEFRVFENIFIDIGDEQSIDNDLSTYTSKLHNLKYFIENSGENTLFLIDELGTGTDPSLGGAIAEATLEALNAKHACGVVTTHYSNLKLLASREPGIANGAMLFDLKRLKPLYKLISGNPGSSFALEIAREIGFPEEVLDEAQKKTGKSQLDFDRELQNLEVEKGEVEKKSTELRVADDFLGELISKYQKLTADLETSKKEILANARREAKDILDNSNRLIEKTIREIKEAQAEKTKTKEIRANLLEEKQRLIPGDPDLNPPAPQVQTISINSSENRPVRHAYAGFLADLQAKHEGFRLTLDLRGKRVDEALSILQRYIDDAILLSMSEVRILHGKGNGVLRQVTRDYLHSQKEVKSARDENLEQGGAGITIVNFK